MLGFAARFHSGPCPLASSSHTVLPEASCQWKETKICICDVLHAEYSYCNSDNKLQILLSLYERYKSRGNESNLRSPLFRVMGLPSAKLAVISLSSSRSSLSARSFKQRSEFRLTETGSHHISINTPSIQWLL